MNIPLTDQQKSVFCFISFSCPHCNELVPELVALNNYQFNLVTDGDDWDNEEVKAEFDFNFPIFSYKSPLSKLNIHKIPYCVLIDENENIVKSDFTARYSSRKY